VALEPGRLDIRYNLGVEIFEHPLQSKEWEEFRKKRQKVSRLDGFMVVWSKIPYTPYSFGYIPMSGMPDEEAIKRLRDEAIKQKAIGIRIEPNIQKSKIQYPISSKLKPGRGLFKKKTLIWDLRPSEEELLKKMHPKGRYNIKVAQKHNVSVRVTVSDEDFEKYLDLMFEGTAKRQGIYSHGKKYHKLLWESLKSKMAYLFVAEYENKILAADIIFKYKKAIYYAYGASALEHKEVMAPTLLLWEIAKWGKSQGIEYFDLWGAEEGKGFTRFKEQFGADTVELPGSFDLSVNRWLYPLFRIAEEVRWKILRILK
jgi:hypothetical protein